MSSFLKKISGLKKFESINLNSILLIKSKILIETESLTPGNFVCSEISPYLAIYMGMMLFRNE